MRSTKLWSIAGGVALTMCSQAFAWSISGTVQDKSTGAPIAGVKVSSFNYAGIETTSLENGSYTISNDGTSGLFGVEPTASVIASLSNGVFSLSNVNAHQLKISVIDALGKVTYQRSFYEIFGSVSIDLSKVEGHGAKFVRVAKDGTTQTYMMKGKNALLKEGDPLPFLQFAKDGYQNTTYQAKAEIETEVIVQMAKGSTPVTSSSSVDIPKSSSSVKPPKSSSSVVNEDIVFDCTGKTAKPGNHNMNVTVDGKKRTFIMHVPDAYKGDKAVPLVVDYHPIGGNGSGQMNSTTYKALTDKEGVISLYPDGTPKGGGGMMGNMNGWNVGPCCSNDDDVKFSRAMIAAVEEIACIDKQRVYATGFSMGGGMSNHVACFMSDVYAAVAPAAMDLNKTNSAKCNPERPISVINFRGTADGTCRYQGGDSGYNDGLNFLGAEGTFRFWAEKNGCTGSPSKNSDGCDEYSNCRDGVKVVLCTKQNGGHEQGNGSIGWPFLKQFKLPASFVK